MRAASVASLLLTTSHWLYLVRREHGKDRRYLPFPLFFSLFPLPWFPFPHGFPSQWAIGRTVTNAAGAFSLSFLSLFHCGYRHRKLRTPISLFLLFPFSLCGHAFFFSCWLWKGRRADGFSFFSFHSFDSENMAYLFSFFSPFEGHCFFSYARGLS